MATQRKQPPKKQPAKSEPVINHILLSIILFGLGVFCFVVCFVDGSQHWNNFKDLYFSLFGFGGYTIGVLLVYLAVLAGMEQPLKVKAIFSGVFVVMFSSLFFVFSSNELTAGDLSDTVEQLAELGKQNDGGGVVVALFGLPLVALLGRPVANIILILLGIIIFMVLSGMTPYDIYVFCRRAIRYFTDGWSAKSSSTKQTVAKPKKEAVYLPEKAPHERPFSRRKINLDLPLGEDIKEESGEAEPPFTPDPNIVENGLIRSTVSVAQAVPVAMPISQVSAIPGATAIIANDRVEGVVFNEVEDEPEESTTATEQPDKPLTPNDPFQKSIDYILNSEPEQGAPTENEQPVGELSNNLAIESLIEKAVTRRIEDDEVLSVAPMMLAGYELPSVEFFEPQKIVSEDGAQQEMRTTADLLVSTLKSFGVETRMMDISRGPTLTRYELQPLAGVKISKITALADDLALNLATAGVRIEAPIPNKAAVGIEVPNKTVVPVGIRSVLDSREFKSQESPVTIALGQDIAGQVQVADLSRMPHLLIAGSTGSGKSVCINSCIISFLCKATPHQLRLILIDPKVVELADYNGIPHLLMPVVTEPRKAAGALGAAVAEMERRYRCFAENNVRDIRSFNALAAQNPDMELEHMPYIAIIIDELADLMMVSGKEVEDYICRIAQKARAAGMHLIVATQRPSVDVITGLIKANIPSRIAFAVSSQIDSRTILDGGGAEKLLGSGDMLYMPVGAGKPLRIQGNFVKDSEIRGVLDFVKKQKTADYDEELIESAEKIAAQEPGKGGKKSANTSQGEDGEPDVDIMFWDAAEVVAEAGMASTSLLQRRLKLGYARAARIMDELETAGLIGGYEGSKPRAVLVSKMQLAERRISAAE